MKTAAYRFTIRPVQHDGHVELAGARAFLVAAGARDRSMPAWAGLVVGVATAAVGLAATSDLAQMVQLLPSLWIVATSTALVARPGRAIQSSKVMIGA